MPTRLPATAAAAGRPVAGQGLRELQSVPKGAGVLDPALDSFLSASEPLDVRPRRTIVAEGQAPRLAFLLISGRAVLTMSADDGREFVADEYLQGDLFGLEALVGWTTVGTVRAAAASALRTMDLGRFERLMRTEPELSLLVVRGLIRRLFVARQRCVELAYDSLAERILAALDRIAEKWGIAHRLGKMIDRAVRCQEIAELVGASRSRVSLALKELVQSRRIVRDGERFVLPMRSACGRKDALASD